VGIYKGKRQAGRHKYSRQDNIEMYLKELGWYGVARFIWLRTGKVADC